MRSLIAIICSVISTPPELVQFSFFAADFSDDVATGRRKRKKQQSRIIRTLILPVVRRAAASKTMWATMGKENIRGRQKGRCALFVFLLGFYFFSTLEHAARCGTVRKSTAVGQLLPSSWPIKHADDLPSFHTSSASSVTEVFQLTLAPSGDRDVSKSVSWCIVLTLRSCTLLLL